MDRQTSRNMDVLKQRFPDVYESVANAPMAPSHQLVPTPAGVPTLKVTTPEGRSIHLHSPLDPLGEAQRIAAALPRQHRLLAVLGCGLFYHVQAALESWPVGEPVLLVEADPVVLRMALACTALDGLLGRPGLTLRLGDGPEALAEHLDRYGGAEIVSQLAVLRHLPAAELAPAYYRAAYQAVVGCRDYAECRLHDPALASFVDANFSGAPLRLDTLRARLPRGGNALHEARDVLHLMDALRHDGD